MNDQLLIDRSLINRIHATAKQGQSTRDLHLGSICCKDIERMCLWALQNGFENGVAKRSGWQMKGKVELIYL